MTHTPGGARGRRALPTPPDAYEPGRTYTRPARSRHRGELVTGPEPVTPATLELPAVTFDALVAPPETWHDGHGLHTLRGLDQLEAMLDGGQL